MTFYVAKRPVLDFEKLRMRLQDSRHGRICLGRSATGKQVARALRRERKPAGHRRVFHHEPQLFFGRKHRLGRLRLKYGGGCSLP